MTLPPPVEPMPEAPAAPPSARDPASLVREALTGPRPRQGTLLFVITLAVFVFALGETSPSDIAILLGVLLWHECGHLVAMRAFRFADVRMFFLPFFGAAVSGRKPGASAVQHAIVSLAGPLPGILLALPLAAFAPWHWYDGQADSFLAQMPLLTQLVLMLVAINAINLLPILPLDGGRMFETVLFSRWPTLDVTFRVVTIAALTWLAMNGQTLFGVIAAVFALSLRYHARVAFTAARLLRTRTFPADPAALTDADLLDLHAAAVEAAPDGTLARRPGSPRALAIVQIFDRVARRPATVLQTLLLMFAWLLGLALAGGAAVWVLAHAR